MKKKNSTTSSVPNTKQPKGPKASPPPKPRPAGPYLDRQGQLRTAFVDPVSQLAKQARNIQLALVAIESDGAAHQDDIVSALMEAQQVLEDVVYQLAGEHARDSHLVLL